MFSIEAKVQQFIGQLEIAAQVRDRSRARRAIEDMWRDLEELYFTERTLDDSDPIGWLLPENVSTILSKGGVRTAGDFRRSSLRKLMTIGSLGQSRLQLAVNILARYGVGPGKEIQGHVDCDRF